MIASVSRAQHLVFPSDLDLGQVQEGKAVRFAVQLSEPANGARFSLEGSNSLGMTIDSVGNFTWIPSFDLVDRLALKQDFSVIFQATLPDGKRVRQPVTFTVHHVNRPPVTDELPVFYVRQGVPNSYQMNAVYVFDPDGDPITVRPRESTMPEGAALSSTGLLTWTPSRTQFNSLKTNPLTIEAIVQDQPDKLESVARIIIKQTQLDLPPNLFLVPA
ncbi:MAG TPA: hypothetical protein PKH51_12815, partial [Candidatus Sumerlaeota bacterium]|nr:hypothetical protein [Candidatus Sumerlaeota bacterium]